MIRAAKRLFVDDRFAPWFHKFASVQPHWSTSSLRGGRLSGGLGRIGTTWIRPAALRARIRIRERLRGIVLHQRHHRRAERRHAHASQLVLQRDPLRCCRPRGLFSERQCGCTRRPCFIWPMPGAIHSPHALRRYALLPPEFRSGSHLRAIERYRSPRLVLVPTMLNMVSEPPELRQLRSFQRSSDFTLRRVAHAAAAASTSHGEARAASLYKAME